MSDFETLGFVRDVAQAGMNSDDHADTALKAIREAVTVPGPAPMLPPANVLDSTIAEMEIARKEGKIAAIKVYRTRTGLGLKEAKDAIERDAARVGLLFATYSNGIFSSPSFPTDGLHGV